MHGFLESALVFLVATVIAVPLFNRLRLGAVLAYLFAGAVLGPHALGLVNPGEGELEVAELGVVLLLFLIGLELSPARLWLMRRALFAVGALQVLASLALLGLALLLLGLSWRTALVAGLALALSSTAVGVQLLAERKELGLSHGRTAIAVLLFQDLVAIPAIALLPLLGAAAATAGPNATGTTMGVLKVIAAIAAVVVTGRYLLRPLFRYVASTRSVEAFTATTLLVVLGTAWLTSLAGLSLALGAFLAGLLLADSEYRHEIEANIEPFKGLLLGLFFLGVGLGVDWGLVAHHAGVVLLGVAGLLALKFAVVYQLGLRVARLERADALRLAVLLAQGGEFAFVLLALATSNRLLDATTRDLMTVVVVASMAATPLILLALERWLARDVTVTPRAFDEIPEEEKPRVIIAGFGRVGQVIARVLRAQRIAYTALEHSVEQVEFSRRFGSTLYYGDPSRPELLRAARVDHAEVFVVATDDPEANVRTARVVKRMVPHLKVLARARNRQHAYRLMDLQVEAVVRETLYSSLVLAQGVLEALGLSEQQARARIERFREHDEKLLRAQHLVYDDEAKLLQTTVEARAELEQIFDADLRG